MILFRTLGFFFRESFVLLIKYKFLILYFHLHISNNSVNLNNTMSYFDEMDYIIMIEIQMMH